MTTISTHTFNKLKKFDSATVANAVAKLNVRPLTQGYAGPEIRCLFPEQGTLLGYAATARWSTRETNETGFRENWVNYAQAIEESANPVVCVMEDASTWPMQGALMGEVMATVMQSLGAVGCLTNGAVRDVEPVRKMGFGYFAAGVIASCGQLKFAASQVPVRIGRLEIHPGDLIHADADGVIVIPHEIAEEIPSAVEEILEREAKYIQAAKAPGFKAANLRNW